MRLIADYTLGLVIVLSHLVMISLQGERAGKIDAHSLPN
jgi:hypothetical protein